MHQAKGGGATLLMSAAGMSLDNVVALLSQPICQASTKVDQRGMTFPAGSWPPLQALTRVACFLVWGVRFTHRNWLLACGGRG